MDGYKEIVHWILSQQIKTWISFISVPDHLIEVFFQILDTNALVIKNGKAKYIHGETSFIIHELLPWFKIITEPGILNREKKLSS